MESGFTGGAAYLYAGAYLGAITVAAVWESAAPLRASGAPLRLRWIGNFAVAAIDTVAIKALVPLSAVAFAIVVGDRGWGVLNVISLPFWAAFALAILALDLGRYGFHRLHHHLPLLWRVHAVHHSDLDYDFTTAFRFHPIEALIGVAWTFALIALLGPSVQHANAKMPPAIDRLLRQVLITPDMHRVHHSARREETDSNFGTVFPFWDRLFGTYLHGPASGHKGMRIGLDEYRDESCLTVRSMLLQPFRTAPAEVAAITPRSGI